VVQRLIARDSLNWAFASPAWAARSSVLKRASSVVLESERAAMSSSPSIGSTVLGGLLAGENGLEGGESLATSCVRGSLGGCSRTIVHTNVAIKIAKIAPIATRLDTRRPQCK